MMCVYGVQVRGNTNGSKVVIMCTNNNGMTTLSKPLTKNIKPIKHSNTPKPIKKLLKLMKPIVCSNKFCTKPLAGLKPTTFKNPNQKNTTNKPNLDTGIATRLQK